MKETGLKGVQMYEPSVQADADLLAKSKLFSRESRGRLAVERSYRPLGFCHVAESTARNGEKINAWDGVLLESIETKKQFPVSANTLMGLTFTQNPDDSWRAHQIEKPKFLDIDEIKKGFNSTIKVTAVTEQPSFDFVSKANGVKKVYRFE